MKDLDVFWKLEALSDRELIESLGSTLGSSRQLMAELIAHLGEVEERRLHLARACSSMFAYCLKLGMSEDEAYRRILAARLARRYPVIFPLLASGKISLSVLALLKHHLSVENHLELLAAVTGKSVAQTRELMAARFPRPDVPSSVRKLPERRTMPQPPLPRSMSTESSPVPEPRVGGTEPRVGGTEPRVGGTEPRVGGTEPRVGGTEPQGPRFTSNMTSATESPARPVTAGVAGAEGSSSISPAVNATSTTTSEEPPPLLSPRVTPPPPSSRIEPLSAQRYKVQLTASAELARKLELARDLMRHSHPGGDLGPIVERALDLLIESLMQRRFGKRKSAQQTSECARHSEAEPQGDTMSDRSPRLDSEEPRHPPLDSEEPRHPRLGSEEPRHPPAAAMTTPDSADLEAERHAVLGRACVNSYIPRSTRRVVVERDGLGCSWVDEHGVRCGSRAWLEYDHRYPRAKGGGSGPDNVRLLCRHHNRFAAEREYGRKQVERTIAERQRRRARPQAPI